MRDLDDAEDEEEVNRRAMEKVRRYQVNRLKYYYAVAEFDSEASAGKVYDECNGMEYELSATRFDLRFVPDDMDFEEKPQSACKRLPDPNKYKPKVFTTTALQQGKVELTWDEEDPDRKAVMRRAFQADSDDENEDARAFLADEGSDQEDDERSRMVGSGSEDEEDEEDAINKYKALLEGLHDGKMKSVGAFKNDGAMQVEFKESPSAAEKKKEKKKAKLQSKDDDNSSSDEEGGEEEEDKGFDDPFFTSGGDDDGGLSNTQKRKQRKEENKAKREQNESSRKGDLSLLTMDSDDDKEHFDYKEIVKQESKKKGKKKKRQQDLCKGKNPAVEGSSRENKDDFKVDLQDSRFSAVFEHPDYNVDPSHPNFKKTKSMQEVIVEKQRRILKADKKINSPGKGKKKGTKRPAEVMAPESNDNCKRNENSKKKKVNLDHLVKSVRAKTQGPSSFEKKRKKKKSS